METFENPYRGTDDLPEGLDGVPWPSVDAARPLGLLARCPRAARTPLVRADALAKRVGVANAWIKDERDRMGLGSFKALGAAYVIASDAEEGAAAGRTYVTASAGNHGLSVAAGASAFGAKAVIFLSETVPESFADRLRDIGAEVRRAGETYEASMSAAADYASAEGAVLLSDSSWPGYFNRPHRLMEGYLVLMEEAVEDMPEPPTHIFLQAGVGGLAAAAAALARARWGDAPRIIVVEPEAAPALAESIKAGKPVVTEGPVSNMGRLDCKEPSLIALKGLARDADDFALITEDEGARGADVAAQLGLDTTPSGAAGLSAFLAAEPGTWGLGKDARLFMIFSEGTG
ncbi:pyridoxal-phosphate dependent enzyme [Alphaproteobacteria bacterium GH1-50]|uniref:Pyridoxal-phosphate dependent enzyme n=1 Tax=Kangsaoukella pontilimi TaxID=2691042 RepID=A0A7C9MGQ2_9RHOB|nr:pyridoxal-phosphate dependent enzyme [Kangsaoukella pontilimi]MXQ09692.1 pyridoxal-phosphate dependent enzyme [Kangsaoukella pontilimi]